MELLDSCYEELVYFITSKYSGYEKESETKIKKTLKLRFIVIW